MRVSLRREGLVLRAEDPDEAFELGRLYKSGHLHLACKALTPFRGRTELLLTASMIQWRRPRKKKPRSHEESR